MKSTFSRTLAYHEKNKAQNLNFHSDYWFEHEIFNDYQQNRQKLENSYIPQPRSFFIHIGVVVLCARCHLDTLLVVRRDLLLTSPCVECCALIIRRGLFATSSFVEGRPLVPSFANVIGVFPLLQASEFYHVRLMKASPKLPFIVVSHLLYLVLITCSCLFFMESLLYTQQNIYQNIDLLKCL